VAGVGNIWKCETCFSAAIDPWRPIGAVSDGELRALLEFARREMAVSAREGFIARPRCGARIRSRGQGDADRRTYWCPGCQQ
jgi:endonuclease-8